MSWVNDLASGLGIPAGAATLSVALYAACSAAEKAARPGALKDIGRVLNDSSWSGSVRPSAIIERIFNWTFGERHLSVKCIMRSLAATVVVLFLLTGFPFFTKMQDEVSFVVDKLNPSVPDAAKDVSILLDLVQEYGIGSISLTELVLPYLIATILADYVALWKTRLLLATLSPTAGGSWWRLCIDALGSLLISLFFVLASMFIMNVLVFRSVPEPWTFIEFQVGGLWQSLVIHPFETGFTLSDDGTTVQVSDFLLNDLSIFSTLFTSVWMVIILVSATVVKLLLPLQFFTAWFFDVDKHPLKAIGIVSAALVMIGGLAWTVLRAII